MENSLIVANGAVRLCCWLDNEVGVVEADDVEDDEEDDEDNNDDNEHDDMRAFACCCCCCCCWFDSILLDLMLANWWRFGLFILFEFWVM